MRTYISPIGYDTRRVTRPVVQTGLGASDEVVLLRPAVETDTERATQAVADVEQLLQEIEPEATCSVERIDTDSFETTVRDCCAVLTAPESSTELIVSLGGGARDLLLPLVVATLVARPRVDQTLFFSDLDNAVEEWVLPMLTQGIPDRATATLGVLTDAEDWQSLSALADATDQSKSTVIRHVNELSEAGLVETKQAGKAKQVRVVLGGELLWEAQRLRG